MISYQKFILLSGPRMGSNMLMQSLRSNPAIVCHGEIMHPDKIFSDPRYPLNDKVSFISRYSDFNKFVKDNAFNLNDDGICAAGFKVFYNQFNQIGCALMEGLGNEDQPLKIVHLTRKNLLLTYISWKLAGDTNIFDLQDESLRKMQRIHIDPVDCLNYMSRVKAFSEYYQMLYADQSLIVFYEDFLNNYVKEVNRVEAYLGVPINAPSCSFVKQNVWRLDQVIINYNNLKRFFINTQWEGHFD